MRLVPLSFVEVLPTFPSLLTFFPRDSTETSAGVHVYKSIWSNFCLWWCEWTTSGWTRSCSELLSLSLPLPLCRVCSANRCTNICSLHVTFLKILTSVLNRFHSLPLHRVNCQLLPPWKKGERNRVETKPALGQNVNSFSSKIPIFASHAATASACSHSPCFFLSRI